MRYKRKGLVDAVKWFPRREYDGNLDPSGIEYTDCGWFLNDNEISPGDFIVQESGHSYIMSDSEFSDEFEIAEKSDNDVIPS